MTSTLPSWLTSECLQAWRTFLLLLLSSHWRRQWSSSTSRACCRRKSPIKGWKCYLCSMRMLPNWHFSLKLRVWVSVHINLVNKGLPWEDHDLGQWRGFSESNQLLYVGIIAVRAFWMFLMAAVLGQVGNWCSRCIGHMEKPLWSRLPIAGSDPEGSGVAFRPIHYPWYNRIFSTPKTDEIDLAFSWSR